MTTPEAPRPPLDRAALRRLFAPAAGTAGRVDKVMPLEAAVRAHVRPGMALHFAYSEGRPIATGHALVRCFAGTQPGFTLSSAGLVGCQAALVTEGLVKKLLVSFMGENYPTPAPNRLFQQAIDSGAVEIENQSLLALQQRLAAGASGLPFAPTRSWTGSSFERNASYARVADPFGGGEIGVLRALVPDITFVHGLAADREGNLLLSPPFGEGEMGAFAASRGVVATVERIVPSEVIERHAALARIPSHRVLSVSEVPLGCHPYALFNPGGLDEVPGYVEDYAAFQEVRRACESPEAFAAWTREWVLGVDDHEHYLRKLGTERVQALRGRAGHEAWLDDLLPEVARLAAPRAPDPLETMVTAAADVLERKVLDDDLPVVEAGVGYANLAAWLAVSRLRVDAGVPAELVAEIGIYGYQPRPGEPFIFSNRNLSTCKSLTGVDSILGLYVGGRHNRCVAIIGAGQIDPAGNINSTYGTDGRFLVGSGGANDIACGARDVVAVTQQSRHRLVEALPYVTSPGANVSTLVTDLGVFEKRDGRLTLTRYHPVPGLDAQACVEKIRGRCGWPLAVSKELRPSRVPSETDLLRLRLFDPRNEFLPRGPV